MKLNTYVQQSSNLFAHNRLLQFVVIVLAVCLMFTSFMAYRAVRYQKVILIPPQMTGTVEFVQGKPTEAYIQDIGRRIISLATTYSPSTATQAVQRAVGLLRARVLPRGLHPLVLAGRPDRGVPGQLGVLSADPDHEGQPHRGVW